MLLSHGCIDGDITDTEISIQGYSVIRLYIKVDMHGGGVAKSCDLFIFHFCQGTVDVYSKSAFFHKP